jgi:predicted alpha-1,6-mannanase (GH76 family)
MMGARAPRPTNTVIRQRTTLSTVSTPLSRTWRALLTAALASSVVCCGGSGAGGTQDDISPSTSASPGAANGQQAEADGASPVPVPVTDTDAGPPSGADGGAAPADVGPAGDFASYATKGATALEAMYDSNGGLFPSTGWWNSANAITALVDTMRFTNTTTWVNDLSNTFSKDQVANSHASAGFINNFYDDEGWWALAWIDTYDLTKDTKYLDMAKSIFVDMTGGWDPSTCNGGIWWSKDKMYKNAIANELFFQVAVRLHERTPNDSGAGSYEDWATKEWSWFDASGMINAQNLVNDGLTSACKNNGQQTWTYNQGVIIGALVDWASIKNDTTFLTRAEAIADATMKKLVDDEGVLHEPCEPSCGGDTSQFKGIFMRHLGELARATKEPRYQAFITKNADWIWNAARDKNDDLGLSWSQSLDTADGARQSSALDALNAAVAYAAPAPNLAQGKTATANGTCTAGQEAAKAFDDSTTTKWCAGATGGAYWLEVDLGAATDVSRIIVRHAGAGGESATYNTKDFTLSMSTDGKTFAAVDTVKSNTRSVTIHRFSSQKARYVRVDIQSPQTDPMFVAARIYELEVYAR